MSVYLNSNSTTVLRGVGPGEFTAPKALTINGEPYQANTVLMIDSGDLEVENGNVDTVVAEIRKSVGKEPDAEPAGQSD